MIYFAINALQARPNWAQVWRTTSGDTGVTAGQTATLTIRDNEPPVTLALSPSSISENGGSSTVTASLTNGALAAFTVSVTESSPAVELGSNTTLSFAKDDTASAGTVTVSGVDDSVYTGSRTVSISGMLSNGAPATAPQSLTLTVTDDESEPQIILTATLSASPDPVAKGSATTVTWMSENATGGSGSCSGAGVNESWTTANGSARVTPSATGTINCSFTVSGDTVPSTLTESVDIPVKKRLAASITASPKPVARGSTTTVTWTSENASSGEVTCSGAATYRNSNTTGGSKALTPSATGTINCSFTVSGDTVPSTLTRSVDIPVKEKCAAAMVTWMVGNLTCKGSLPETNHDTAAEAIDSTIDSDNSRTGSAWYQCFNGQWSSEPVAMPAATCTCDDQCVCVALGGEWIAERGERPRTCTGNDACLPDSHRHSCTTPVDPNGGYSSCEYSRHRGGLYCASHRTETCEPYPAIAAHCHEEVPPCDICCELGEEEYCP